MKYLIIILRLPFALLGGLGMLIFIPFAALIFFPAGVLWAVCGVSLLSPLINWLFNSENILQIEYKERLLLFFLPVILPIAFAYNILMNGEINPQQAMTRLSFMDDKIDE